MSRDADALREQASNVEDIADALDDLRSEVITADAIGDTRLSGLFHEARTNSADAWKRASAFVDIEDGEAVVTEVSKLRDGRWTPEKRDRHDAIVTVGVRPFMDADIFKSLIHDELMQAKQGTLETVSALEQKADHAEMMEAER